MSSRKEGLLLSRINYGRSWKDQGEFHLLLTKTMYRSCRRMPRAQTHHDGNPALNQAYFDEGLESHSRFVLPSLCDMDLTLS